MIKLKFNDSENIYNVNFIRISDNVVRIEGEIPHNISGFTLSRDEEKWDDWDYHQYTTIYNESDDFVEFSNDESVYVESDSITQENYVLSDEEKAIIERQNEKNRILNQINELKNRLSNTDYIIIKAYESALVGEEMDEYDFYKIHNDRQEIREQINDLENELLDYE